MATKPPPSDEDAESSASQFAGTVKESAQQIWLAGLGAFSKAQEEGGKVFQALVKEGVTLQKRTQAAAEEKLTEASGRMSSMASDLSSKASGQWDTLGTIFEERVSRALKQLGVPTARDIEQLTRRVDALERSIAAAPAAGSARKSAAKRSTAPASAKTPAAKRAPRRTAR
ncbi:MAG: phasin family protein [Burkholderiales bacterium]